MKDTTFLKMKKLVKLIEGDRVDQGDLFEAQDIFFALLLEGSTQAQKADLCKSFPYIYYTEEATKWLQT